MAVDPLSPIAPARIRALLLPVGRIKRSRFLNFVDFLQPHCTVRLGDVSPDSRPDRNMFSPLAFPNGTLLYDLSTSLPPPSHLSLSPFEQFREPLLIIGIADASEYPWLQQSRAKTEQADTHSKTNVQESHDEEIQSAVENLREQFPRAYLHSLIMFDCLSQPNHPQLPSETLFVPPASQVKMTTMKTLMCDLTSTLLAEMTTLAKSIQVLPTVSSPASQAGVSENVPSWANGDSSGSLFSRRNSQIPTSSASDSSIAANAKDLHRMSMPVLPSSSGSSLATDDPRASSPTTQGARTPPTTFDEISGINAANTLHRTTSNSSKSKGGSRDRSADRVSIHGFGSGGAGERARNKGRGRIGVITGTLYLCAGQWQEALKELTEAATQARTFSDHLWHAKALENIMVCLLLFAWSGMDFQIPQICYTSYDKSSGTKSPQHTPTGSLADIASPAPTARSSTHEAALESLNSLLPDLVNMILNIYTRAANFPGESLPPLAFSECVIRFSKLLAAMNLSAGYLDEDALQYLVQNTPFRQKPRLSVPRLAVNPTRNDIAAMLFRALPGPADSAGMSATDRVVVLAGVASVLSSLELQRKKAIVMKEFITSLIPGLVQARKVGAAEMGVHPAAGLAALNMAGGANSGAGALHLGEGEVENGIDEFLTLLGRVYGIPDTKATFGSKRLSSLANEKTEHVPGKSSQSAIEEILRVASLRSFGSLGLKLDILRMCINFCEALPDFNGVLHFTALLLRIAGPGTAPKPNSTDVFVSLPRDEQVRLFANISRTVAQANKLGLKHVDTDYWDDFLVRGLFIMEPPAPLRLTHHRPAELKLAPSSDGPFIHNPWNKTSQGDAVETVLVANEEYRFVIALQNPYDFELEVDSLRIAAEGVEFVAHEEMFILGPYRTQKFPISGIARREGTLKIIGCYVKVTGCAERLFPIFPDPWRPERELKMKRIGLKACLSAPMSRPTSAVGQPAISEHTSSPKPETLTFSVIPDQPIVAITDVALPQGAVMVLEGEKKRFTISVKNTSQTTTVDFVHITFQDSATTAIQTAISNKDIPAAELHELEIQLAHYPSLRWIKADEESLASIKPGQEAEFEIEVIGRIRLTEAIVQIDYAHLGKRRSEITEKFFTRQVSVPISITVNASVQLQRPDILPLSGDLAWYSQANQAPTSTDEQEGPFQTFLRHMASQGKPSDEYCMLLLDLRNSWPNPLHVFFQVGEHIDANETGPHSPDQMFTVNDVIQPGHVNRIVILLPKIYLKDPYAPVPSLNKANQRQFVVSASKISPELERANREAFWYRHELLQLLRGTWKEEGHGRTGDVELRTMRFAPRMVEAIKLGDIHIETSVEADFPEQDGNSVRQLGHTRFEVSVDQFLTMKTRIYNRSHAPIAPLLRLQPHLAGLPHNVALDLDKRFSWTGVLQRRLPTLQPGQSIESELGIIALASGTFEIGVTVDEIALQQASNDLNGNRPRSGTATMQGEILGEPKLRSWHSKEPCTVIAKRGMLA